MFCSVQLTRMCVYSGERGGSFTKAEFEAIALKLDNKSFINPYKNMFGLGNFDVSVLMMALQQRGEAR